MESKRTMGSAHPASPELRPRRAGFTLIEVMAAIVILLLLVGAMGQMYASATKAFQDAIKQTERDASARAVLDYIARELSSAYFERPDNNPDALLSLRYEANTSPDLFGLEGADEIWFVSLSAESEPGDARHARQVVYYVTNSIASSATDLEPLNPEYRFRLMRGTYKPGQGPDPTEYNVYVDGSNGLTWAGTEASPAKKPGTARAMIENIRTFEIFAYEDGTGKRILNWDSNNLQGLFCLDLYLETMSESDAIKAAELAKSLGVNNPRTVEFVESVVRRHFQRVYFPAKTAYYDGPLP